MTSQPLLPSFFGGGYGGDGQEALHLCVLYPMGWCPTVMIYVCILENELGGNVK